MIKQLCDSNDGAAPEDGLGWAGIDGAGRVSFLMRHSRFGFDTSSACRKSDRLTSFFLFRLTEAGCTSHEHIF